MSKRNFAIPGIVTLAAVSAITAGAVAMSGAARQVGLAQVARPALQLVVALAGHDGGSFAQAILITKPVVKPNPPGPRPPPR
jgi:hypothetical protein